MKKLALAFVEILAILIVSGGVASAMTINGPYGTLINGWYKDSFSTTFMHGTSPCGGVGTAYTFVASSNQNVEGTHHFVDLSDSLDNLYVSIDNAPPFVLDRPCPVSGNKNNLPPLTVQKQFDASLDISPPSVSITNPIGAVTTSADTYTVSGIATDSASGVQSVTTLINGTTGPIATRSGTTYSVAIPLSSGVNSVQFIATDLVGHTKTSNTATITSKATAAPLVTSTIGSDTTTSSGTAATPIYGGVDSQTDTPGGSTSNNSPASSPAQSVKFNAQQILNIKDADDNSSDPINVQATAALSGVTGHTYQALLTAIVLLLILCGLVVWRFRPIFAELDRDRSGLRRRIIIIVTLPSLVPLLGLGFLGYQQLSHSVKNSLSSQLEKAAQTSALKLDREFNIRRTIITKTSSDILQMKQQYQDQRDMLAKQKDSCSAVVKTNIPKGQYSTVTSNDDCLPFLGGFAQLASNSSANVSSYLTALEQGATQAGKDVDSEEQQRVDELLGSVKHYFPDLIELNIVDNSKSPVIKAILPRSDTSNCLAAAHASLLAEAPKDYLAQFDATATTRQLILTYPVKSGSQTIGGAIAAFDTTNPNFIPSIWSSTPKPYAADQIYFVTTAGELITPTSGSTDLQRQLKTMATTAAGSVYDLKLAKQTLAARTSAVSNTNWVVAVAAPASSLLAPLAGIQRTAILAIGGFILLSVLLGMWFVSGVAREVDRLFRGAKAFDSGKLDYRIKLHSHDELQVLGETMNKMATDINAAQTALVEKDKEFINIATHELKAPMTSIIGNLSMITEDGMGQVDDTARKLITQAYNGTTRLRDIVTDMLDIARLESGHAQYNLVALDVPTIIQNIIEMQTVPAQQTNVALVYQPSEELPNVMADKNKLQIIVTNFISNAVKYNRPGGSVTISHSVKDGKLVTTIADTGLGIPEDQKAHMFEKFFRVQNDDRANVPGTGLGMHLTKCFVEGMGGNVWFESVHGKGTTFYFSMPLAEAVKAQTAVPQAPSSTTTALENQPVAA